MVAETNEAVEFEGEASIFTMQKSRVLNTKTRTKLRGRSPQVNYTDRATAASQRS
jgi:hypothetical protein